MLDDRSLGLEQRIFFNLGQVALDGSSHVVGAAAPAAAQLAGFWG